MDVVIEPVLLLEEVASIAEQCRLARLLLAVIKRADVAAGAKRLLAGPLQQHADDGRILLPAGQRRLQQLDHLKAQGIEGGGAVQGQHADVATIRGGVGLDAHRLTHGWPPQTGYQPLRHGGPPSLPHSSFTPFSTAWVGHSASAGPASRGRRPPLRAGWHRQTG